MCGVCEGREKSESGEGGAGECGWLCGVSAGRLLIPPNKHAQLDKDWFAYTSGSKAFPKTKSRGNNISNVTNSFSRSKSIILD